jgi:hypothetical protein
MTQEVGLAVLARVDAIERHMAFQSRLFEVIAARANATHVSLREAARIFGCSTNTARVRFAHLLEQVPGARRQMLPVAKLRDAYISAKDAKRIRESQQ